MSRMANWAKRIGQDGFQLAKAIFRTTRSSGGMRRTASFKPILLEQAQRSNRVANSLLQVDKQVGLVRYYGFMGYIKEHFRGSKVMSAAATPDNTYASSSFSTSSTDNSGTARVAFMITASMKQELTEGLGYNLDQIKQIKPLQASLILHHQITPENLAEQLPIVEKEYQEQKRKEQELRQLEIQKQEADQLEQQKLKEEQEQQVLEKEGEEAAVEESSPSQTSPQDLTYYPTQRSLGYMSQNTLLFSNNSGFGSDWFEVLETNTETNEQTRVGLHQDEREALLGLQTRQEIADTKERPLKYDMKPVDRSQIFSK